MRLFARVAEERSFTAAARALGVPKQTLSRRIAELERALGTVLLYRTTRRLRLSDVGAAYAQRCSELVRISKRRGSSLSGMPVSVSRTISSRSVRATEVQPRLAHTRPT